MIDQGLHWIDWALIFLYAVGVIGLGWYNSKRHNSKQEYFTGGGNMPAGMIGISLFVTLLSTISYLSQPGEMIKHGPVALAGLLAIPFGYVIVGYLLIPVLMRQRVTSAYELLEERLGIGVRLMGATMFVVLRLVWMSLLLYLTSSALVTVLGLSSDWTLIVSLCCGAIAILYTSIGGIRTVVITDVIQFVLLFGGALLTLIVISMRVSVLDLWPTSWAPNWDEQPFISFDPHVRVSVIGSIISILVIQVATAGGDQTAIQRYMSTSGPEVARRSYLVKSIAQIFVTLVLSFVGFGLLGFFSEFPEALPEGMDLTANADQLFPLFIGGVLPVGFSGLVIVALFAAAMSSIDSGINSITAVAQTDIVDRCRKGAAVQLGGLHFSKYLAFGIGMIVILLSSYMQYVPGNFLELTMKTANLLVVPLFSLFVMALFVPFATASGAVIGAACGLFSGVVVAYWDVITGWTPVSFQLIGISSLIVNLAVGVGISRFQQKLAAGGA